ncbi:MAG: cytochrome c [Planctomycetes bacterium]|nr:cytochrome c [Planctomycetota bacterium]
MRAPIHCTAALLALAAAFLSAGCRQDMHDQPKLRGMRGSAFFADGRGMRPTVPGTVARGQLNDDELLHTGKLDGKPSEVFPFEITRADLERGRERFEIYCTPCHDRTGSGNGMIVQRGMKRPPSYHIQRLREQPPGYFFDVMTNGFGAMFDYSDRIKPEDRWRIAAYIRVLQLSQNGTLADVPPDERTKLEQQKTEGQAQ